uniref:B9 domain-containing protein 1 n=1 Tax=Albugo laibachii Nc14 TaxID=890382 RepID=F0WM83_9STRA|nr:sporangia induced hypothetical protein [Albugo laibachii Nc14]|eukprot:CCA22412.1 sporangia induced hypothetical protein [Albugo laibachii Nc14]
MQGVYKPSPTTGTRSSVIQVMFSGQIESINIPGISNIYCRYTITSGSDWHLQHGLDTGLSQIAYGESRRKDGITLNFPIDISYTTTNLFGWPRVVLSVYGLDLLGRDVVRGYGTTYLPTAGCNVVREIPLFKPQSSTLLQHWTAKLSATQPEYYDSRFIAQNEGRAVTRVSSGGKAVLRLNTMTRGMMEHGYILRRTTLD